MTTHRCPSCGADAFTWSVEEESGLTQWRCSACELCILEDESKETTCPQCHETSNMLLLGPEGPYFYCVGCGISSAAPE